MELLASCGSTAFGVFSSYPALVAALEDGSDNRAFHVIKELFDSSYKELDLKLRFVAVLSKKICDAVDAMESREVSAHKIYKSANNLLQWLNSLALEDYENRTKMRRGSSLMPSL